MSFGARFFFVLGEIRTDDASVFSTSYLCKSFFPLWHPERDKYANYAAMKKNHICLILIPLFLSTANEITVVDVTTFHKYQTTKISRQIFHWLWFSRWHFSRLIKFFLFSLWIVRKNSLFSNKINVCWC